MKRTALASLFALALAASAAHAEAPIGGGSATISGGGDARLGRELREPAVELGDLEVLPRAGQQVARARRTGHDGTRAVVRHRRRPQRACSWATGLPPPTGPPRA